MKITEKDKKYPEQLKSIEKPPKQLYIKGNVELLYTPAIAIIGSRNNTNYGGKMAKKFAKELSLKGFTIISGMAKGIDSFAHIGAIEGTGNTIAVIPSGFDNIYPEENKELFENIIKNGGLVVTEYNRSEKADYKKFLERNRIVSGLAIGTLVIEGGHRSGTSVTAEMTRKQEKQVFCIPSNLDSKKGITPNKLIKEGAFLVTKVNDITEKYPNIILEKRNQNNKKIYKNEICDEYKDVYNILDKDNLIHINEIAKKSKLNINEVNYKLMMLELDDKIVSLPGNNYKIK